MTIDAKNIEMGVSFATTEFHFSGGLRGSYSNSGWTLFPITEDYNANVLVFQNQHEHARYTLQECGVLFLGTCVKSQLAPDRPPMEVWEPEQRNPENNLNSADSWRAIAHQASLANDTEYADCASYISMSLKVGGLRLKDVCEVDPGFWTVI